jgi:hypothetical protein
VSRPPCDGGKIMPKVITKTGMIEAHCACGDSVEMPDKGLGRAYIASWRTRHQPPRRDDDTDLGAPGVRG